MIQTKQFDPYTWEVKKLKTNQMRHINIIIKHSIAITHFYCYCLIKID